MPIAQAFSNWTGIAEQLHELFARSKQEAICDSQAFLASTALEVIEKYAFYQHAVEVVRAKAKDIITSCVERYAKRIERTLAEPKNLLKQLDSLILLLSKANNPMSEWDAREMTQELLDVCRRFDKSLSAIPGKLKEQ